MEVDPTVTSKVDIAKTWLVLTVKELSMVVGDPNVVVSVVLSPRSRL